MLTLLMFLMLLAASVGLFVWTRNKYIEHKDEWYSDWNVGFFLSCFAMLAVLIIALAGLGCQYSETIYLPLRLDALNTTIEQQSAYITAGVDGSIAQGLEGLEIKREIQQTIRERNELIATILYRQRSPWYLFRPEMEG